jgi:hypothetical protein
MIDLTITQVVTHDSLPGASVTVRPANYRLGILRTVLNAQAIAAREKDADMQNTQVLAGLIGGEKIYPSLIAATVEQEGFDHWPLTSDEVLDLPEGFVVAWEQAVYALNPQWLDAPPTEPEKKG